MSGFIDPDAHDRSRLDRLEVLLNEALRRTGIDSLSPDAQAIYQDLMCSDPGRVARARARLAEDMAADPLSPAARAADNLDMDSLFDLDGGAA